MDDSETAADGLDFTPPDTPSQHHQPGSPMDGAMGNSPSKDDAGAGAAGGSQMSQPEDSGGILASLGPLTSPSNPTAGDAGGGVKDDAAVAAAAGAAADEGSDDDDEMTPSMYVSPQTLFVEVLLVCIRLLHAVNRISDLTLPLHNTTEITIKIRRSLYRQLRSGHQLALLLPRTRTSTMAIIPAMMMSRRRVRLPQRRCRGANACRRSR